MYATPVDFRSSDSCSVATRDTSGTIHSLYQRGKGKGEGGNKDDDVSQFTQLFSASSIQSDVWVD